MKVEEVMVTDVKSCAPFDSLNTAAQIMLAAVLRLS